ncbi:ComF family protein [Anaerolineae bacterium CFX9]|nr:ComF family protein [Anaerolineae bacterium CFX9]
MSASPYNAHSEARASAGLPASVVRGAWRTGWLTLLDWLYPPRCAGCDRVDQRWCPACADALEALPSAVATDRIEGADGSAATGIHTGVLRHAVRALKYEQAIWMASVLGERLARVLREKGWMIDTLVPVPLFSDRLRERGYNQSQLLGEIVAQQLAIPLEPKALIRARNTQSQVGLTASERQSNLRGAFQADPQYSAGRRLLLIDDVHTTGATLTEAAAALRMAGAAAVYTLTVSAAHFID